MTIQVIDGFDLYNGIVVNTGLQAKWVVDGTAPVGTSGVTYSMVAGRFGGQAASIVGVAVSSTSNINVGIVRSSPVASASGSVGFAMRTNTSFPNAVGGPGNGWTHIQVGLTGIAHYSIRINSDGSLTALRHTGANGYKYIGTTVLGSTAAGVVILNSWQYIELEHTLSATVGVINVWVDGVKVLALTGINNINTSAASATFDGVSVGLANFSVSFQNFSFNLLVDDFYLTTGAATRLGEARVETLRPSADTATKNWTPNSGTANFSRVNETLVDGDTSYISASTVGTADLYAVTALSSSPAQIMAVQVTAFAEKTDATTRAIALSVKSGATASDGANFNLNASYSKFDRIIETDPNTSAAWTAAAVNALQVGPKVTV